MRMSRPSNVSNTEKIVSASPTGFSGYNCSSWPTVQGNPDIAGTGVLVGFMLPTYITLILVILHYLSDQRENANPVDRRLLNSVKFRASWKKKVDLKAWATAMEASVLMFSDIQIITSIAILLCGYTQLPKGLSAYHWQVVISLAWFPSLTHLATLSSLRDYFQSRPAMALCRSGLMGAIIVLLSVASGTSGYVPQFSQAVDASPSWPAACLFSPEGMREVGAGKRPPFNTPLVVLSIAFLVVSFVIRVFRIFERTAGLAHGWLKETPRRCMRRWYVSAAIRAEQELGLVRKTPQFLLALVYILCKAVYDIGASMLWEIIWLLAALAWGSLRLVGLRVETPLEGEDAWGFGQILPVLLTALPLWSIISTAFEEHFHSQHLSPQKIPPIFKHQNAVGTPKGDTPPAKSLEVLAVSQCTWYSKFTLLLLGFALVLTGSCVYNFPAAALNNVNSWNTDTLTNPSAMGFVVAQYATLLGVAAFIAVVFASVGLAVHMGMWKLSGPRVVRRSPKLRELLWDFLVVFLVLGLIAVDWFVFDGHKALLFRLPQLSDVDNT